MEKQFQPYQDAKGRWHCGAPNQRNEPCGRFPVAGSTNRRCMFHGGNAKRGVEHHNFKHGRHSKVLSAHPLGPAYHASLDDPNQLSLAADIALIDALQRDYLERLDLGASDRILAEVREKFGVFVQAMNRADFDQARFIMAELEDILESAPSQTALVGAILDLSERRRKLANTEARRLVAMENVITPETYMAAIRLTGAIIREHERNPAILGAIQADLERYLVIGPPPGTGPEPGGV